MKIHWVLPLLCTSITLSGCGSFHSRSEARASSSLVGFLYPKGEAPPADNSIPELRLPLRVGLAFLPSRPGENAEGLDAVHREEILQRIRARFADRKFVSQSVIVPDYYLRGASGFEGLAGVQRLYDIDIMALVSYDQVAYGDENKWSVGYLTIVGAYFLKGNRHDVTTLMDLAVVDPASRSILLRAGGGDTRHGTSTLIDEKRQSRESRALSYSAAAGQLIDNFDAALVNFEADVKEGRSDVHIAHKTGDVHGGGAIDPFWLTAACAVFLLRRRLAGVAKAVSK